LVVYGVGYVGLVAVRLITRLRYAHVTHVYVYAYTFTRCGYGLRLRWLTLVICVTARTVGLVDLRLLLVDCSGCLLRLFCLYVGYVWLRLRLLRYGCHVWLRVCPVWLVTRCCLRYLLIVTRVVVDYPLLVTTLLRLPGLLPTFTFTFTLPVTLPVTRLVTVVTLLVWLLRLRCTVVRLLRLRCVWFVVYARCPFTPLPRLRCCTLRLHVVRLPVCVALLIWLLRYVTRCCCLRCVVCALRCVCGYVWLFDCRLRTFAYAFAVTFYPTFGYTVYGCVPYVWLHVTLRLRLPVVRLLRLRYVCLRLRVVVVYVVAVVARLLVVGYVCCTALLRLIWLLPTLLLRLRLLFDYVPTLPFTLPRYVYVAVVVTLLRYVCTFTLILFTRWLFAVWLLPRYPFYVVCRLICCYVVRCYVYVDLRLRLLRLHRYPVTRTFTFVVDLFRCYVYVCCRLLLRLIARCAPFVVVALFDLPLIVAFVARLRCWLVTFVTLVVALRCWLVVTRLIVTVTLPDVGLRLRCCCYV